MTRLVLLGDVMTGRGIDQVLPHPGAPEIHEPWLKDARDYVALAEKQNGPIPRGAPPSWPWGDALDTLDRRAPAIRIANVETSVTRRGAPWPKGINYRMNPDNLPCLSAARLDVCVLANNHVLDFGVDGLHDTLTTIRGAGMRTCGAGLDDAEAWAPAVVPLPTGGRLLVYAVATDSSGVPSSWAAGPGRPGVARLDRVPLTADALVAHIDRERRPGDRVVLSIHWGGNWGYDVPPAWTRLAHGLVAGGIDVVFGHSSHHPRPAEIFGDRPILYGCGDFINDYEGISGHQEYRPELVLAWIVDLDATGALLRLEMVPFRMRRFRLENATAADRTWLRERLGRICLPFGGVVVDEGDPGLRLVPAPAIGGPD